MDPLGQDFKTKLNRPQNLALIRASGSDATVRVELWDEKGRTSVITSAGPTESESAALTISSTGKSLSAFMKAAGFCTVALLPDIAVAGIPDGAVGGKLTVLTNSVAYNFAGSDDGSGTNGLDRPAPTADTPSRLDEGESLVFGRPRPSDGTGGGGQDLAAGAATAAKQDETKTLIGAVNETAPASDTASSGLNGRLQRIAQRITSLIALLPAALSALGNLKVESGLTFPGLEYVCGKGEGGTATVIIEMLGPTGRVVAAGVSCSFTVTEAALSGVYDTGGGTFNASTMKAARVVSVSGAPVTFNLGGDGAGSVTIAPGEGSSGVTFPIGTFYASNYYLGPGGVL